MNVIRPEGHFLNFFKENKCMATEMGGVGGAGGQGHVSQAV
jgi:hypothetical protein